MALQGTIDTFDLTEVIRMLAVGEKTGRLGLSGDRGSGSIWFADGKMVASDTDSTPLASDHAAVLFQLLRFREGSFIFDQGAEAPDGGQPVDSEPVIEEALRRAEEWTEIEAVVPSLDHGVALADELRRSDVVIDQARWRVLATIAGGTTVGAVGRSLELDELEVSRTVKGLVELTLVEVTEPADGAEAGGVDQGADSESDTDGDGEAGTAMTDDDGGGVSFDLDALGVDVDEAPEADDGESDGSEESDGFDSDWLADVESDGAATPPADTAARDQLDALASGFGLTDEPLVDETAGPEEDEATEDSGVSLDFDEPAPLAGAVESGAGSFPIEQAEAAGEARTPLFAHDAESAEAHVPAPGEAAEVARQLANLSPEAARAVAAAARATTVEEREAALALVAEDGDEPLDPDLLRSFLSSVRN